MTKLTRRMTRWLFIGPAIVTSTVAASIAAKALLSLLSPVSCEQLSEN